MVISVTALSPSVQYWDYNKRDANSKKFILTKYRKELHGFTLSISIHDLECVFMKCFNVGILIRH